MAEEKKPLDTGSKPIIGNFNLAAELPNKRSISVAGYLYEGEDVRSVNDRLDLCQEAIERQRLRCEIPELEVAREQRITAMKQMKEVLDELAGKQQAGRISSQERMTLKNMQVNLKKGAEDIDKGEIAIADAKRKAGVA